MDMEMTAPPAAAMATVIIVCNNNRWRMMVSYNGYRILASRGHGSHIECAQRTDGEIA